MPIPCVDPDDPFRGPKALARAYAAFARTPVGRWLAINVVTPLDPFLLRVSGGRVSMFAIYHHVLLTVPGRRTGIPRTVPLLYFTRGDDVVLMASSYGRPEHPAWYRNVLAHPEVTLTGEGDPVPHVAREAEGEERDELLEGAVRLYGGYADYQERIAAGSDRHLPVIVCTPVEGAAD